MSLNTKPLFIVVHGGPGLDHTYLECLNQFSEHFEFIFYDQLGSGVNCEFEQPTLELLVKQLVEIIQNDVAGRPYSILAHSWGTHVAISTLAKNSFLARPESILFVNPCPLDYEANQEAGQSLMSRIPENIVEKITSLSTSSNPESGAELMKLALPYYCGKESGLPDIKLPYWTESYNSISESTGNYNIRGDAKGLGCKSFVVSGELDYIIPNHYQEIVDTSEEHFIMEGCGHFSFAESPSAFSDILDNVVSSLG